MLQNLIFVNKFESLRAVRVDVRSPISLFISTLFVNFPNMNLMNMFGSGAIMTSPIGNSHVTKKLQHIESLSKSSIIFVYIQSIFYSLFSAIIAVTIRSFYEPIVLVITVGGKRAVLYMHGLNHAYSFA